MRGRLRDWKPTKGARRGVTALEFLAGAGVMVLVLGSLTGLSRLSRFIWWNTFGRYGNQSSAASALGRIEGQVREARSVVVGSSSEKRLTVQMPLYQNGSLVLPLQNGRVFSFYLSDTSGRTDRSGTILWRMVDGTPDRNWSMIASHPRVEVSPGGLKFTYLPNSSDPAAVTMEITTSSGVNGRFTTSETFLLRNKGL